jgi:hypothetical protein
MKKRQNILLPVALVAIALIATACAKTTTNANNANTSTTTSNTGTTNTTNTTATTTNTSTNTSTGTSPAAVIAKAFDASKNRDVAGFKKAVSSVDLKELDEMVKKGGGSVDDFLKEMMSDPDATMPASLETRNEKIDGDKATIEYKSKAGEWKTAHFIKEGGEWKMRMGNPSSEQPAADNNSVETDDHGGSKH